MKKAAATLILSFMVGVVYADIFHVDLKGIGEPNFDGIETRNGTTIKIILQPSIKGHIGKKIYFFTIHEKKAVLSIKDYWDGEMTHEECYDEVDVTYTKDFSIIQILDLGLIFTGFPAESNDRSKIEICQPDDTVYYYALDDDIGGK